MAAMANQYGRNLVQHVLPPVNIHLESVGQTLPQLPWKEKRGFKFFLGFLSLSFMKLCWNIHRSVAAFEG
jgi:hypothetical protein